MKKNRKIRIASIRLGWLVLMALIGIAFELSLLDDLIMSYLPKDVTLSCNSVKLALEISVVMIGVGFEAIRFFFLKCKIKKEEKKETDIDLDIMLMKVRARTS